MEGQGGNNANARRDEQHKWELGTSKGGTGKGGMSKGGTSKGGTSSAGPKRCPKTSLGS